MRRSVPLRTIHKHKHKGEYHIIVRGGGEDCCRGHGTFHSLAVIMTLAVAYKADSDMKVAGLPTAAQVSTGADRLSGSGQGSAPQSSCKCNTKSKATGSREGRGAHTRTMSRAHTRAMSPCLHVQSAQHVAHYALGTLCRHLVI